MTATTAPTTSAPAPATAADRRPSLVRLTGVELRKMVDTRSGRWLLISIGLVIVAMICVVLFVAPEEERTFVTFFAATLQPVALLLPVVGILSVTSEWSHRTALSTFTLVPQRHRVLVAKLAAVVPAALLAAATSVAVAAAANVLTRAVGGAGTWEVKAAQIPYATLFLTAFVLMGTGFGMLLGNAPLAIVTYLVLPTAWTITSGLVPALEKPARWLDTAVTTAPLLTGQLTGDQWQRLAVSLLVWVALPVAVGTVRVLRREVA